MRLIPLSQGLFAKVDDDDFDRVNQHKWTAAKSRDTYYAVHMFINAITNKRKSVSLHRFILNVDNPNIEVDHENHDGLDCQKSNIRECTPSQNKKNVKSKRGSSSKYLGVSWYKQYNKWRAMIKFGNKHIFLGYFDDEIQCAKAYDKAARLYHKGFANLNFPND